MKKTVLLTFCITLLAMQFGLAQSDKKVPAIVTATFMEKYPGTKVNDWDYDSDNNGYKAEFSKGKKKSHALFTEGGAWVNTITELKLEELPPAVLKSMTEGEYKDWTFGDYMEVDSPEGKRYNIKAKYNPKEHHLTYNEAGLLLVKTDAKPGK